MKQKHFGEGKKSISGASRRQKRIIENFNTGLQLNTFTQCEACKENLRSF